MFRNEIFLFLLIFSLHNCYGQQTTFPIAATHSVPAGTYSNVAAFSKMKEAGINIGFTEYNNIPETIQALKEAEKAGVKMIVFLPDLLYNTENAVKQLKDYPALFAYSIKDEPSPKEFSELRTIAEKIRKIDSKAVIYINLLPNYASFERLGNQSYSKYVESFLQTVKVPILSFDHYPVLLNSIRPEWYNNLEDIRSISLKLKIPFWAFANSMVHYDYPQPTFSALRLQQFSNLLYGAQGLQYFTYWTNSSNVNWIREKYGHGIVDSKGIPTVTYDIVKSVNEQIHRLSWVFLGAKSDAVYHTGNPIPKGTRELSAIPPQFKTFSTNKKDALVAMMSNKKERFIIVQNKDLNKSIYLYFNPKIALNIVNNNTGKKQTLKIVSQTKEILPGDILIFNYTIQ